MTSAPLQPETASLPGAQGSELDFVRTQSSPRGPVAWKRLAGSADPTALYVGYGVLCLLLACLAAALPIMAVAVIPGPSPAPPLEAGIVLTMSAVSFGLCWPVFIGLMMRRRHGARAFVRDAVLLDAVISREARGDPGRGMGAGATASFTADGFERRADLGLGLGDLEGAASILFAPQSGTALVFPETLHGRSVRAHVRGEIINRAGLVSVVLRRGFFETLLAALFGLAALQALLGALAAAHGSGPAAGGAGWAVAIVIALLYGWFGFLLTDGWRATLTFDASAGALIITKQPALAPPWRRAIPLSSIATVDLRVGMLMVRGVVVRTLTLRLCDASGRALFSRWQLAGGDMKRELEAVLQKVRAG